MNKKSKIFVAGHRGMVGSAIARALKAQGYENLLLKSRAELDLIQQKAVFDFFEKEKPELVFLAAAKVGGIVANGDYPADFIYQNLQIQNNIIQASYLNKVRKLLFLGSSCIYPRLAPQPMQEKHLLTGPLEPTNEPYALAKIAGIKMCQSYNRQYGTNFIACMPTNLYGPNDNFDLESSHVLPAMIRKFHEAKESGAKKITLWGTGSPKREFLYVDDLAEACIFLMEKFDPTKEQNEEGQIFFNVGTGEDLSIKELADKIKKVVGFEGEIVWDESRPDGTPRKLLDVSSMTNLGWQAQIKLDRGIQDTYDWYLKQEI